MHKPRLIALYSPTPGCGKTSIAAHLVTEHGYVRVSFADPMRSMLKALLTEVTDPLTVQECFSRKEAPTPLPYGPTLRHMMQTLGTEWGRNCIGPQFWSRLWSLRVLKLLNAGASVVCDDMRFPEELTVVQDLGGQTWRVTRPGHDLVPGVELHPSDGALEGIPIWWDHLIRNDGTPDMLLAYIDACLNTELVR